MLLHLHTMFIGCMFGTIFALLGPVHAEGFADGFPGPSVRGEELLKEKRGFPDPRGAANAVYRDVKRDGLNDGLALLHSDEDSAKRSFGANERFERLRSLNRVDGVSGGPRGVSGGPRHNLRSGLDVRRAEFPYERKQPGFPWPNGNLNLDMSIQRHIAKRRNFNDPRGMLELKRDSFSLNHPLEYDAVKRNKFQDPRGELAWKRQDNGIAEGLIDQQGYSANAEKRARPDFDDGRGELAWKRQAGNSHGLNDNTHYVPNDDPRLY